MPAAANVYPIPTQFQNQQPPAQSEQPQQPPAQSEQPPAQQPPAQAEQPKVDVDFFAAQEAEQPPAQQPPAQAEQPPAQAQPQAGPSAQELLIQSQQAQMQQMQAQMQQMQAQMQQQQTTASGTPDPLLVVPDNTDLTGEEKEALGEHVPGLRKIVYSVLSDALQPALDRIVKLETQLKETASTFEKKVDTTQATSFNSALALAVPDQDTLLNHPAFQGYLAKQVPYTNQSIRDVLTVAYEQRDVGRIKAILDEFRTEVQAPPNAPVQQGGQPVQAAPSTMAAMSQPNAMGAAPSAVTAAQLPDTGQKLLASKFVEYTTMYTKGLVSQEEYQAVKSMYEQAEANGLVVNDIGGAR